MLIKISSLLHFLLAIYFIGSSSICLAQGANIDNDIRQKKIVFGNDKIRMTLDYNRKADISQ
jgi:hypothetical protein